MEYSEEVAVLLGAFSLLEYKFGASELKELGKDECEEAVNIVRCAVNEILEGLNKIPKDNHVAEWRQKLTSLLLHGLLQSHRYITPEEPEQESSYDRIASFLPAFSHHLYFNIIKQLRLTPELLKGMPLVEPAHIQWLTLSILQHIDQQTNNLDIQLFADLCEFLTACPHAVLTKEPTERANLNYLEEGQDDVQTDYHGEIQELFCEILRKNLPNFTSDSQKKAIFVSMLQLSCGVYVKDFSIDKHIVSFNLDNPTGHITKLVIKHCKDNILFQDNILSIVVSCINHVEWVESIHRFFKIFKNFQNLLKSKQLKGAGNINDLCSFTYTLYMCELILLEKSQASRSHNDESGAGDWVKLNQEQVLAFLEDLELKVILVTQQETEIEQRKRVYNLEIALQEITQRSEHHQEYIHWLLRQRGPIVQDERYVTCLLENTCLLASEERFYALLDVLLETAEEHTKVLLKEVCLGVFRELPLSVQNHLHKNLPEKYTTLLAKCMDEPFQQQVTQVLNQVVNNVEGIDESVKDLSPLALLCPVDVVHMALSESITNSGQNTIIIQILHKLPNICVTFEENNPRIGRILHDVISKKKHFSSTEVQNLLELLRGLLDSFIYEATSMSLLGPRELIQMCIVEYLTCGIVNDNDTLENCTLELALKMLLVAIDTKGEPPELATKDNNELYPIQDSNGTHKAHWIFSIDPIPLLQTLCGLLDDCRFLWFEPSEDCDTENKDAFGSKVTIKTLTVEIIEKICHIIVQYPSEISDKSFTWLYNTSKDFHWTTRLHLHKLFNTSAHKITVPMGLADYCSCTTQESKWTLDQNDKTDGLLVLLQVGCSGDDLLTAVMDDLVEGEVLERDEQLYGHLVLVLAQLLPQCIQPELHRMMNIVQQVVKRCPSSFQYRTLYTNSVPIAMLHEDCFQILMICQLVCDILCLLKHTLWMSIKSWNHVAKSFTIIIQNLLSKCMKTKRTSFMEHQIFCHTCSSLPLLPESAQEHVYLLLMDILSNYLQYKKDGDFHMQCCIENLPQSQYKDNLMKQWNC